MRHLFLFCRFICPVIIIIIYFYTHRYRQNYWEDWIPKLQATSREEGKFWIQTRFTPLNPARGVGVS